MNPIDAFKRAMFYISGLCSQQMLNKPGAVIERLSDDTRSELKKLKSSDIDGSAERLDDLKYYVGSNEYYQNKKLEAEKMEFDKKLKK